MASRTPSRLVIVSYHTLRGDSLGTVALEIHGRVAASTAAAVVVARCGMVGLLLDAAEHLTAQGLERGHREPRTARSAGALVDKVRCVVSGGWLNRRELGVPDVGLVLATSHPAPQLETARTREGDVGWRKVARRRC